MPREDPPTVTRYHFGAYALNLATRELRRGGQLVETTPKMFELMVLLVSQRHRVVPHDELIDTVWARAYVSAGVLPQMVRKLRMALDQPGQRASWIKGVRGVGYRFVGRVDSTAVDAEATPAGGDIAPAVPSSVRPPTSADQVLYLRGREQIRRDDLVGLAATITALRAPADGGGTRRCLVWAEIFESHRERLNGNSKAAWHHLRSAQLMMDSVDDAAMRSEFHSMRGLYFESFTSEAEALAEFETAWSLAHQVFDTWLMAGCAARLAYAFARSRNWPAFEQWVERSLQLAAQIGPRAIFLRHSVGAAMSWQAMGTHLAESGDLADARLAWAKSLRLNEAVLNEPATADVTERTRRIAWVNWLSVLARLHPERRGESLQGLQACLADEQRPAGRAQLLHVLAGLLRDDDDPEGLQTAAAHCRQALAICAEFGLNEQRDELLDLSAAIATSQGEHASANRWLRELLQWRSEQSARQAERVAAITAVRLETERVLALAEAEREKSRLLSLENQALRQRAALLERLSEPDPLTGLAPSIQFERQLAAAWEDASLRGLPLCVAVLELDDSAGQAPATAMAALRGVARQLLDVCREGDLVASLRPEGRFGIVFHGVGLARALPVCERIRALLHRDAPPQSVSIGLADVGALPEAATALPQVFRALDQARASGGNQVVTLRAGVIEK